MCHTKKKRKLPSSTQQTRINMNTFLCFLFGSVLLQLVQCINYGAWENVEVEQSIELNRVSLLHRTKYTIKNVGDEDLLNYFVVVPPRHVGKISYHSAALAESLVTLQSGISEDGGEIVIVFPSPIEPNQEISILLMENFNNLTTLATEYIGIGEDQKLLVPLYEYPQSHYPTKTSSTTVLGAPKMEFVRPFTPKKGAHLNVDDNTIGLGPYFDLDPTNLEGSVSEKENGLLLMKYLFNSPLTRVVKLERDVWVSHWADTVQFEEHYDVINDAAKLENGFSRAEWMVKRAAFTPKSALVVFDMPLPEGSFDHYYTDVVGMVTTWKYLPNNHMVLKPRYPIFGGWMANFTIGWTNALGQFSHLLNKQNDEYLLQIPLVNGPKDTIYDEIDLNVYLPEGAKIIDVYPPSVETQVEYSFKKSYFDLNSGHLKTNIKLSNINDEFNYLECHVHYQYSKTALYSKPLYIAMYVFLGLLSFFAMKRIDFSIEKNK